MNNAFVALREALALAEVSAETFSEPNASILAVIEQIDHQSTALQQVVDGLQARYDYARLDGLREELTVTRSRLTRLHVAASLVEASARAQAAALRERIETLQTVVRQVEDAISNSQMPG